MIKVKHLLCLPAALLLLLPGATEARAEAVTTTSGYTINFPATQLSTHAQRFLKSFSMTGSHALAETTTVSVNTAARGLVYHDCTSSVVYLCQGDVVTTQVKYCNNAHPDGGADWMHAYLYVDLNQDGDFTDEGEKVASQETATDGQAVGIPQFTLSATQATGTYHARLKIDWSNTDPGGDEGGHVGTNTIWSNGGAIVDFTLSVSEQQQVPTFPATTAALNFDKTLKISRTDTRQLSGITLKGETSKRTHTAQVAHTTNDCVYQDLTQTDVFTLQRGEPVMTTVAYPATWMQAYLYIDRNNDGEFSFTDADGIDATKDLMTYWGYNGKTSMLESVNWNNQLSNVYLPVFALPYDLVPGYYCARLKIDWGSLDPKGHYTAGATSNNIDQNGGYIVDFTLHIVEPEQNHDPVPSYDGYELVWSDEFDDGQIDATKWQSSPRYGEGSAWNRFVAQEAANEQKVSLERDGCITFRCMKNLNKSSDASKDSRDYISGAKETCNKFIFRYGRVEARMKCNSHTGHFPAFWLMPQNNRTFSGKSGWPYCGEIDIMETIDNENKVYNTIHTRWKNGTGDGADCLNHGGGAFNTPNVDMSQWHVYGLEWTPERLTWYVDGRETAHYDRIRTEEARQGGQWPFDKSFYIILNQSVGKGTWASNPDPNYLYETNFDWVRVYQRSGIYNPTSADTNGAFNAAEALAALDLGDYAAWAGMPAGCVGSLAEPLDSPWPTGVTEAVRGQMTDHSLITTSAEAAAVTAAGQKLQQQKSSIESAAQAAVNKAKTAAKVAFDANKVYLLRNKLHSDWYLTLSDNGSEGYAKPLGQGGDAFKWVIQQTAAGKYFLYNLQNQQFLQSKNTANTHWTFSATPGSTCTMQQPNADAPWLWNFVYDDVDFTVSGTHCTALHVNNTQSPVAWSTAADASQFYIIPTEVADERASGQIYTLTKDGKYCAVQTGALKLDAAAPNGQLLTPLFTLSAGTDGYTAHHLNSGKYLGLSGTAFSAQSERATVPVSQGAVGGYTLSRVESVELSVDEYKFVSRCLPVAVSLAAAREQGLKAFVVSSQDEHYAYLEEFTGEVLPRETPVFFYAEAAASFTLPITAEAGEAPAQNSLRGVLDRQRVTEPALIISVQQGDDVAKLRRLSATNNYLAANRAYLPTSGASATQTLRLAFDRTTALPSLLQDEPTAGAEADHTWYSLSGRRVAKPAHGVYVNASGRVAIFD